jgi:hypothetical protein
MNTLKETCPKCGEISMSNYELFVYFACDTKVYTDGSVKDGEYCKLRCRITELEKDKTAVREALEIALKETQRSHARQLELEKENDRLSKIASSIATAEQFQKRMEQMTPQISKEAMEKAHIIAENITGEVRCEGVGISNLVFAFTEALAIEFTSYQKRIEELEKDLIEAHVLLTGCHGTLLFKSGSFAKRVENFISKSHLAKGVKE